MLEKPGIWVFELVGGKKEHLVASNEFGDQDFSSVIPKMLPVGLHQCQIRILFLYYLQRKERQQ